MLLCVTSNVYWIMYVKDFLSIRHWNWFGPLLFIRCTLRFRPVMTISTGLFSKYMSGYAPVLGISWDELIGMGRQNPDDHSERFCMSTFACNTCQEVNGVSWLHGKCLNRCLLIYGKAISRKKAM